MGKFTAYKLPLKSLGEGVHKFEYKLDKQFFVNMEYADIRDADINVELTVDHHNGLYKLDFVLKGTVTLLCDRCLDDLVMEIDTTYTINVEYGADYNDDSDDLLIIPEADNTLNVAYMLYDTIVLAIPIKHVHPLGKCNRAMSALLKKHRAQGEDAALQEELMEGIDDETSAADPRWDALKGMGSNNTED